MLVGGTWFFSEIACISISGEQRCKQEFDAGHLKARDGAVVRTIASQQCGPGSNQVVSMPFVGLRGFSPGPLVFPFLINRNFQIPISQEMVGEPCRHATSHLLNLFISCI